VENCCVHGNDNASSDRSFWAAGAFLPLDFMVGGADNIAFIEGRRATCGTVTAGMTGGSTAASGYNLAANGGLTEGTGLGEVMATVTAGDSVCVVTSAAVQLSGHGKYAIY
jgi:hypothetical protein